MKSPLIQWLHEEMRDLTLRAGVPDTVYDGIFKSLPDENDLYAWLQSLRDTEYATVEKYWNLHRPEKWARYEALGPSVLKEWQLLQKAYKALRDAWRKM